MKQFGDCVSLENERTRTLPSVGRNGRSRLAELSTFHSVTLTSISSSPVLDSFFWTMPRTWTTLSMGTLESAGDASPGALGSDDEGVEPKLDELTTSCKVDERESSRL